MSGNVSRWGACQAEAPFGAEATTGERGSSEREKGHARCTTGACLCLPRRRHAARIIQMRALLRAWRRAPALKRAFTQERWPPDAA